MNDLQIFQHDRFGQVRMTERDGDPWFVAADVCRVLDHSNVTIALERLDDDEKAKFNLGLSGGETNCVNESGLYALILGSRKHEAKAFKRWITHDVIPAIRRHGMYMSADMDIIRDAIVNPKMIARLANALDTEQARARELSAKIEMDQPKVAFAEAVESSCTAIHIGDLAKLIQQNGIPMGQNRLFEWMRAHHYLIQRGERRNMPTQRSLERGFFQITEKTLPTNGGTPRIIKTTKVTGKGQVFFINLFIGETAL